MEIFDKFPDETMKERAASLRSDIDAYIAAHYRPPYTEHDIALEECEDDIPEAPRRKRIFGGKTFTALTTGSDPAIDDFLKRQGETFSQMLLRLIDERNLKDSEVYRNANIDRRLFSKIRGDEDYIPSKKTAICFCMALGLDIEQTKKLLETAGYALSTSSRFDLIIMYLIEKKEYNVVFANIVLESYGEGCLTK